MPTQDEVRHYLKKSGDEAFAWQLPLAEFEGGWFNYQLDTGLDGNQNDFVIFQAYGKHSRITAEARRLAKKFCCTRIICATSRNGEALARLLPGKVIGYLLELPTEVEDGRNC